MNKFHSTLEVIRLCLAICRCILKRSSPHPKWPPFQWILGHRGARSCAPENTLSSFRMAMDLGADGVEFDVVPSRDGIPVVIHDDTLERTTNGKGLVWEHDLETLAGLDATKLIPGHKPEGIPSLLDALATLPNGALVNVELKNHGSLTKEQFVRRALADIHRHEHRVHILISSFDAELLCIVRAYDRKNIVALLLSKRDEHWPKALRLMDKLMPDALHLSPDLASAPIRTLIRLAGMRIALWTINDSDDGCRWFKRGIDGIFTDCVEEMIKALRPHRQ